MGHKYVGDKQKKKKERKKRLLESVSYYVDSQPQTSLNKTLERSEKPGIFFFFFNNPTVPRFGLYKESNHNPRRKFTWCHLISFLFLKKGEAAAAAAAAAAPFTGADHFPETRPLCGVSPQTVFLQRPEGAQGNWLERPSWTAICCP